MTRSEWLRQLDGAKVGFTGTRHGLAGLQREALRYIVLSTAPREAHHGDCVGADATFHALVELQRDDGVVWYPVIAHPAPEGPWSAHTNADVRLEPLPPLERNRAIVEACDVLIACPLGDTEQRRSGTWATVRYARKQGKRIIIVWPSGVLQHEGWDTEVQAAG